MAYKFQTLAATMSGSLTQEGSFTVKNDAGTTAFTATDAGVVSGSGNFSAGGTVSLLGVAQAAVDIAADSLYYFDATDGKMKSETVGAFMADIAGDGLAAASNQLAVQVDDSTIETDSDQLRLKDDGVTGAKLAPAVAGAGLGQDGSGNLDVGAATNGGIAVNANDIGLDIGDLAAAAIASGDTFAFDDSGTTKKESVDDLATLFAGAGLGAASAVLAVQASGSVHVASDKVSISGSIAGAGLTYLGGVDSINGLALDIDGLTALGGATVAQADNFLLSDAGSEKKITFSNLEDTIFANINAASSDIACAAGGAITLANNSVGVAEIATAIAGDGLTGGGGSALAVQVSGAITIASDKLGISGSFAGTGIGYMGGVNSIEGIELDLNELTDAAIANGDSLAFIDATDSNVTKKESVADLAALFAGAGLAASNSVIAVANASNGGLAINANDMNLDFNDLTAAAVDVAADSIAIVDANDSNATRKESIADLVTAMAGGGLTATSGVLSVQGNSVALKADGNSLVEGYNYFADASSNATVTMPASPSVGDVVTVKAGNLTSNAVIIINKGSADHRMDGLESLRIESPFGAVTMVYAVADHWKIV